MEVFLIRHATRNFTLGDVPLNEVGLLQAKELSKNSAFANTTTLLSSPKRRACMTLQPIAEKYNLDILTFEDLDQLRAHEDEKEFTARIQNFLNRISNSEFGKKIILCSHSDWLSVAVGLIPTDALDLRHQIFQCAEYLKFNIEDGLWKINDN